jgi:hypothetical protein
MTLNKLDPHTPNNDIGLYIRRSRRVVLDTPFGEMASWIKAGTAGDIVWKNSLTGEEGIWNLEAGESFPVQCDEILTNGSAGGPVFGESTSAGNLLWASTPT